MKHYEQISAAFHEGAATIRELGEDNKKEPELVIFKETNRRWVEKDVQIITPAESIKLHRTQVRTLYEFLVKYYENP